MYFLVMCHVLFGDVSCTFGDVCKPSGLVVKPFKIPKYYKVFINKRSIRRARDVRFVFIYLKYKQQTKENKKGKFLTKLPILHFKGQALFSSRKFPSSKEG